MAVREAGACCTRAGRVLSCPVHEAPEIILILRAGPDAVAGAEVTISSTVTGQGVASQPRTSTVHIGHGADLVPAHDRTAVEADATGPVTPPVEFTNWGDEAADGFDLRLESNAPFGVDVPGCQPEAFGETVVTRCRVDERIRPGGHYEGTPYTFRMNGKVGDVALNYWVEPTGRPPGVPYDNTKASFDVHATGKTDADIAVEGSTAAGLVGEVASAVLTIRNLGPADATEAGTVYFESPAGTEITGYPQGCGPSSVALPLPNPNGEPVQQTTQCLAPILASGRSHSWNLSFRIVRAVSGGYGRVEYREPADLDAGNNTTVLTVQSAPGPVEAGTADPGSPLAWWRVAAAVVILISGAGLAVWGHRRAALLRRSTG
ncbi:hypothetical protein AB0K00_37365 [Dactylosporangium sp. NPDC049525]|uniref:hypothetical protein n=1 Tax=Dactylosporangium sp. NPDC049525 TaxID=3154730 RepID=UPI00341A0D4A